MKKIRMIILSLILILLTTGCSKGNMAVNIKPNGTVAVGYQFLVEQEYATQLTKDSFTGIIKDVENANVTLIDYEENGKKYAGYQIVLDTRTINEFNELSTGYIIETDGKGNYIFMTNPNGTNPLKEEMRRRINDAVAKENFATTEEQDAYRKKLTDSVSYELTVIMPGRVTDANTSMISEGIYTWKNCFDNDVYIRSTTQEDVELLPTDSKMGLYLAIGGASVIFLGMIVFLISALIKVKKES